MRTALIAIQIFSLSLLVIPSHGKEINIPALKHSFKDSFLIGGAIKRPLFEEKKQHTLNLAANQFNSISSCNMLKWRLFNPYPGVYNHELADKYVEFGHKNNMYVVGHVLFWHNLTPNWVYQEKNGQQLDRKGLLKRMRERVRHVSKRYGNKIHAWDVVNESILGNGKLRYTQWTKIVGKDFIEQAFRIAGDELPANVGLLYNDYGMTAQMRRRAVVKMIKDFKEKGVRIDGVGMQGHWSLNSPTITDIEASIIEFAEAGVDVHITELDIDLLPCEKSILGTCVKTRLKVTNKNNPYPDGLPEEVQQKLAKRYSDLFRLFLKHKDKIKRVTFWGITDKYSWLNNWPIKGRTSHPLLFDREGQPKAAFHAVIALGKH